MGVARRNYLAISLLVLAGEAVFFLPFVVTRVFRPTFLEVFQLSNVQLGLLFSAFGLVAMLAYFPGGPLADRFSARVLMSIALVCTALGGLLFLFELSFSALQGLYVYWGLTTIFLFWAALIRATREWGGAAQQGLSFGLLDGGRGLVAAVTGSLAVSLFAFLLPEQVEMASLAERKEAFRTVILAFASVTLVVGGLVFWYLPKGNPQRGEAQFRFRDLRGIWLLPAVWLQGVIVVCAYIGYQGTNDFALYAQDALGMNEVDAARVGAVTLWLRPVAAVGAGLLADRTVVSRCILWSFGVMFVGCVGIASGLDMLRSGVGVFIVIATTCAGVYALRGLYYAVMEEGNIPLAYTGTAVGLVSVVGYTPDIFMSPIMGWLIDRYPGALGHQYLFAVVAGAAVVGMVATLFLQRCHRLPGGAPEGAEERGRD